MHRIQFSLPHNVVHPYPTTKVCFNGLGAPVWIPYGRWDSGRLLSLVPRTVVESCQATRADPPEWYKKRHVTFEGHKRELTFAKVRYELRDEQGYALRWDGVVAAFKIFGDDRPVVRDTAFLGLHQCIEYLDPKIRMRDRSVAIDDDIEKKPYVGVVKVGV